MPARASTAPAPNATPPPAATAATRTAADGLGVHTPTPTPLGFPYFPYSQTCFTSLFITRHAVSCAKPGAMLPAPAVNATERSAAPATRRPTSAVAAPPWLSVSRGKGTKLTPLCSHQESMQPSIRPRAPLPEATSSAAAQNELNTPAFDTPSNSVVLPSQGHTLLQRWHPALHPVLHPVLHPALRLLLPLHPRQGGRRHRRRRLLQGKAHN